VKSKFPLGDKKLLGKGKVSKQTT